MVTKAKLFKKAMAFLIGDAVTEDEVALQVAKAIQSDVEITDVSDIGRYDYAFSFDDGSLAGY